MTVRGLLLALVLLASMPVEAASQCHRYARWHYPWRQRCGVQFIKVHQSSSVGRERSVIELPTDEPDFPLPLLTRNDCRGGEADELTRARLELLGYAYAH